MFYCHYMLLLFLLFIFYVIQWIYIYLGWLNAKHPKTFRAAQRRVVISDCRDMDETNDIDGTMFFVFVRKMSANGGLPSNVDPITARTTNECHRPLTRPRISNPVSVITTAETRRRRGREEVEVLKGKHGSAAAGGRFRSDPFPESRLPNVNFGRRCWIPYIYGYVPSWLTSIATVREFPGFSIWAFFPRSSDSQLDERASIRFERHFSFSFSFFAIERIWIA